MNNSVAISTDVDLISSRSFDYYRATVRCDRFDLLEAFDARFPPSQGFSWRDTSAVRFFSDGEGLYDEQDVRACALYRSPKSEWPHIIGSGFYSDGVASIVRRFEHSPSRIDVFLDLAKPGLFAHLLSWSERFAESKGIARSLILNDDLEQGCTIYLGSRQSPCFVRIYQPGLLRAKVDGRIGDQIVQLDRDAVRIELEHKPEDARQKARAAQLDPCRFWGLSKWTTALYGYLTGLDVLRVAVLKQDVSDRDRALRHMAGQYRNHLTSLLAEHQGDFASFGADIWDRMGIDLAIRRCD